MGSASFIPRRSSHVLAAATNITSFAFMGLRELALS